MSATVLFANKLELCYHFNDKSGYIDAAVRNRCEKEVLAVVNCIIDLLDVKMMIYHEPCLKEGGYRELWPIAYRNSRAVSVVLNIIMQTLTRPTLTPDGIPHLVLTPREEEEFENEVMHLRHQLKQKKGLPMIPREFISQLNALPQLKKHKSAFYETVKSYPKITKITVRELNENNRNRSGSLEVKREMFELFICKGQELSESNTDVRKMEFDRRQLRLDLFGE